MLNTRQFKCSVLVRFGEPLTPVEAGQLGQVTERVIHGWLTSDDDAGHRWLVEWEEEAIQTPGWAGGVAQLQAQTLQLVIATLQSLDYTTDSAEIIGYSIERVEQ